MQRIRSGIGSAFFVRRLYLSAVKIKLEVVRVATQADEIREDFYGGLFENCV